MNTTEMLGAWTDTHGLRRDLIPGYVLLRELGRGATGVVYLARTLDGDRRAAIKILSPQYGSLPESMERLEREARTLEELRHPNIVQGFGHGVAGGHPYFVMEHVVGETIAAMLRRRQRIPEDEALRMVESVALALEEAHRLRILHRDIKPANIIIEPRGDVKLMDFGLVRREIDPALTSNGVILGTPIYISPEQASSMSEIDIRSDIYSLGITLYHMVAGDPPFSELNTSLLLTKKITDEVPLLRKVVPDASPAMEALVRSMCRRDRDQRVSDPSTLIKKIGMARKNELPIEDHIDTKRLAPKRRIETFIEPQQVENPILRRAMEDPQMARNTRFLEQDQVLFYEEDGSRECYILLVGKLEILKAGRRIAMVEQSGSFLGEMSTLLNAPRTATVRATEPAVLLELTEQRFRDFLRETPDMAWHLSVELARRLESTNQSLKDSFAKLQLIRDHWKKIDRELTTGL